MFGFEKLEVYSIAHRQYLRVHSVVNSQDIEEQHKQVAYTLRDISLLCLMKFTEGSSIMEFAEKKKLYTESRTAVFHAATCLKLLLDLKVISSEIYDELYANCESLSRMMLSLIKNMNTTNTNGNSSKNNGRRNDSYRTKIAGNESLSTGVDSSYFGIQEEDDFDDFNKLTIGE